jgi:hypothetical protein
MRQRQCFAEQEALNDRFSITLEKMGRVYLIR